MSTDGPEYGVIQLITMMADGSRHISAWTVGPAVVEQHTARLTAKLGTPTTRAMYPAEAVESAHAAVDEVPGVVVLGRAEEDYEDAHGFGVRAFLEQLRTCLPSGHLPRLYRTPRDTICLRCWPCPVCDGTTRACMGGRCVTTVDRP
jgi:hypothetical protein